MTRVVSILITFLCGSAFALGDEVDLRVRRDLRVLHDVVVMDPISRVVEAPGVWLTAEVKSAPDAPYGTTPGAYFLLQTGQLVMPPKPRDVIVWKGSMRFVKAVTGKASSLPDSFEWMIDHHSRDPEELADYSPYRTPIGRFVLVRYDSQKKEEARFRPSYAIPEEWADAVSAAVEKFRSGAEALWKADTPQSRAELGQLLTDRNAFVALAAFKTLAAAGNFDSASVVKLVANSGGWMQSARVFEALRSASPQSEVLLTGLLLGVIGQAHDEGRLRSLALAAVETTRAPQNSVEYRVGTRLLRGIKDKTRDIAGTAPAMEDLQYMLTSVDFREEMVEGAPTTEPETRESGGR